jgi:isoquinoline 1-oxidoreductase beta subunit
VIRIARSEMGQGTLTGLAQLVAEELECDWNKVTTEGITPGRNLRSKRAWGEMGTGGSRGIRTSGGLMSAVAAAAHVSCCCRRPPSNGTCRPLRLTVADGVITHCRKQAYDPLRRGCRPAAAKLTPPDPKAIKLKDPKNWKVAWPAAEAARYRRQARRQQDLRDRS